MAIINEIEDEVYNICYGCLLNIVDKIILETQIEKRPQKIMRFLMGKDPQYNKLLVNYLNQTCFCNVEMAKRIMILIIAEKSYILNMYNDANEIEIEHSAEYIEQLEELSAPEIIELFLSDKDFAINITMDFLDYTNQSFVFETESKSLIISSNNKETLFRINPFSVLDLGNFTPVDEIMPSELLIQRFINFYDRAIIYLENHSDYEEYESDDELLVAKFIEYLEEFCQEEVTVCEFICFIFASIYEYLISYDSRNEVREEYQFIKQVVENNSPLELVNRFLNDYYFAIKIIEIFITCNDCLQEGELLQRRYKYKLKRGDIKKLQRLNPFYNDEEKAFKNKKNPN